MKLTTCAVLLLCCSTVWGQQVRFQVNPGEQNGTHAAFAAWRASEVARQGGTIKGQWWWGLTACDITGDGYPDLVATNHSALGGVILRNDLPRTGRIGFTDVTSSFVSDTRLLPIADKKARCWDFDKDGRFDIAGFSNEQANRSFFNDPGGLLRIAPMMSPLSFPAGSKPGYLRPSGIVDLNGDGYLDVTNRRVDWIFDPGRRTFIKRDSHYVPPVVPQSVLDAIAASPGATVSYYDCCDLNGDGLPDVLVSGYRSYSNSSRFTRLLIRRPDGTLHDETAARGLPLDGAVSMIEEILGDSKPEIAITRGSAPGIYVTQSDGTYARLSHPAISTALTFNDAYQTTVEAVDFNGDGFKELIIHLSNSLYRLFVFEHTGAGYLPEPTLYIPGGLWRADAYDVADLDQDGALDLMAGFDTSGPNSRIVVYRNTSLRGVNGLLEPPLVFDGGVLNSASLAPHPAAVAPGSIASVFGSALNAGEVLLASRIGADGRLATTLGGARATVNDIPVPVLYSTLGQLGIQVPYELAGANSAVIRVIANGMVSPSRSFPLDTYAPGVFTLNRNGAGPVAALREDGATLVTAEDPARPGEVVTLFGTGLGPLIPPLETGAPAAVHVTEAPVTVLVDGIPAELLFSGAAPGFVGLNQLSFRIPSNTRADSAIPLVLTVNGRQSNTVSIPVGAVLNPALP